MADVSHIGGLIAAGVMRNPFDAGFDVVTTTTHKSLRGPRGGLVLCRKQLAPAIDKSVFPGLQGGPHMHTIAGIAVTLKKAQEPAFRAYGAQVLRNAKTLAAELMARGARLVTGGTDNHMMVLDTVASFGLDGRRAEEALDAVSITTNKQVIPDDPHPAAASERHPPRHAGRDDARHGRGRHAPPRRLDGRRPARAAGRRGARAHPGARRGDAARASRCRACRRARSRTRHSRSARRARRRLRGAGRFSLRGDGDRRESARRPADRDCVHSCRDFGRGSAGAPVRLRPGTRSTARRSARRRRCACRRRPRSC